MRIRHIATSNSSTLFATGASDHHVRVWDLERKQQVAEFDTILDFGGRRLALMGGTDPILIAGAYNRYGVCAYNALTGEQVWCRRDLKNPQVIRVNENVRMVSVSRAYSSLYVLDGDKGETIRTFKDADACYFGPIVDEVLLTRDKDSARLALLSTGKSIAQYKYTGLSLDAVQTENSIVISGSGAPGSFWKFNRSGTLLRETSASAVDQSHFIRVAWSSVFNWWLAIDYQYQHHTSRTFKVFNESGTIEQEIPLGKAWEAEFASDGRYLITSKDEVGEVLELPDLRLVWRFQE